MSVVGVVGNCDYAGVSGGVANTGALKNGLRILKFDILDKSSTSLQLSEGSESTKTGPACLVMLRRVMLLVLLE